MDKSRVCCFTGHRNIEKDKLPQLMARLDATLDALIDRGVVCFGSGGATGWDALTADAVLRQKAKNSAVKLIMVLPFRGHDSRWSEADRREFRKLCEAADKVVCLAERYSSDVFRARNEHLVRNSSVCVAYMTDEKSGTGQTVRMAKKYGLEIINLAE